MGQEVRVWQCVSGGWKNIFVKVKLFWKCCVKGYEQHKLVKKDKKRIFLAVIGNFFVILQPEIL
jgi:hypothetical protein